VENVVWAAFLVQGLIWLQVAAIKDEERCKKVIVNMNLIMLPFA